MNIRDKAGGVMRISAPLQRGGGVGAWEGEEATVINVMPRGAVKKGKRRARELRHRE